MSWSGKPVLASLFLVFALTSAQAAQQPTAKDPAGSFQVKFNDGDLSVDAHEAPLVKIFDEIRKQASVVIDGSIGPEEKITIQFQRVALDEAVKRLAKNIMVFYTSDRTPRIARIVLLPAGKEPAAPPEAIQSSKTSEPPPRPEPFKFEFDPTKSVEKKPR